MTRQNGIRINQNLKMTFNWQTQLLSRPVMITQKASTLLDTNRVDLGRSRPHTCRVVLQRQPASLTGYIAQTHLFSQVRKAFACHWPLSQLTINKIRCLLTRNRSFPNAVQMLARTDLHCPDAILVLIILIDLLY